MTLFSAPLTLLLLLLTLHTLTQPVSSDVILEEGYSVSTVLDGNKVGKGIIPTRVLSGKIHELIILDSTNSALYTVPLPISPESAVSQFSGNGTAGFADGDLGSAMFDHPAGFAVDNKGNVYVADTVNHVIRKLSKSGVTTIAGGHSGKTGKVDGPAQDASFSDKFDLTFIAEICALLIADRGNGLIRLMNLRSDDCESGSGSRLQMGLASSAVLGVSCLLLGLAVGSIISYRFLNSRKSVSKPPFCETWKHNQMHLERRVLTACSDSKSAVARIFSLLQRIVMMSMSHASLMLNIFRLEPALCRQPVTYFDSDGACNRETSQSPVFADQLKDLISFDDDFTASEKETSKLGADNKCDVSTSVDRSIDGMICANIMDFTQADGCNSGLVKRR